MRNQRSRALRPGSGIPSARIREIVSGGARRTSRVLFSKNRGRQKAMEKTRGEKVGKRLSHPAWEMLRVSHSIYCG